MAQDLHCLPLIQQVLDMSAGGEMELFHFNLFPAEPGYTLPLQTV